MVVFCPQAIEPSFSGQSQSINKYWTSIRKSTQIFSTVLFVVKIWLNIAMCQNFCLKLLDEVPRTGSNIFNSGCSFVSKRCQIGNFGGKKAKSVTSYFNSLLVMLKFDFSDQCQMHPTSNLLRLQMKEKELSW